MPDMIVALNVHNKLNKKLLKDNKKYSVSIWPYINGRENGLMIYQEEVESWKNGLVILFSENRNSDDIMVCFEHITDMPGFYEKRRNSWPEGWPLSENAYEKNRKFFRYDKVSEAAKYINSLLRRK